MEGAVMAFNVKKRGKLTYYYHGDHPTLSALVTEELPDGDLKIYFAGLTGGYSAKGVLKREELVSMDPEQEIPLVFKSWEVWLKEAGICDSLREVDFIEIHAFGCQPKSPNPLVDPAGYAVSVTGVSAQSCRLTRTTMNRTTPVATRTWEDRFDMDRRSPSWLNTEKSQSP